MDDNWIKENVTILNSLGLHTRAAAAFTKTASSFDSDIKVRKDNMEVDGKSIMGLMMLAMPVGESFEIHAAGTDAKEAVEKLTQLVADGFGEKG
jgi:phosphocarrier protein